MLEKLGAFKPMNTADFISQRAQAERVRAARRTAENNVGIEPKVQYNYAIIVAVDELGGFSKEGKIPWHYPTDFKWFKQQTIGHVCVMGRSTYEDINERMGERGAESVLPDRKCFVVSSQDQQYANATPIKHITDVEQHLTEDDADKTIFLIGGERVFREGLSLADIVYLTAINKDYQCDKFFHTQFLETHFRVHKMYSNEDAPDLRFLVYVRNK